MRHDVEHVYVCELCGDRYETEQEALKCESKPVMQHDFTVGKRVRILNGEGKGRTAKISRVLIAGYQWGHYYAKKYHHTPLVQADIEEKGGGSRQLCYDDCELLEDNK